MGRMGNGVGISRINRITHFIHPDESKGGAAEGVANSGIGIGRGAFIIASTIVVGAARFFAFFKCTSRARTCRARAEKWAKYKCRICTYTIPHGFAAEWIICANIMAANRIITTW